MSSVLLTPYLRRLQGFAYIPCAEIAKPGQSLLEGQLHLLVIQPTLVFTCRKTAVLLRQNII